MNSIVSRTVLALSVLCLPYQKAKADFWGGDTLVLTQILTNSIEQLYQLMEIVNSARDNLELIQDINRGINDSLHLAKTSRIDLEAGLGRHILSITDSQHRVKSLYGSAVNSKLSQLQNHIDKLTAEGISQNSHAMAHANTMDPIGEQIKTASHTVSPGGAQKLTAEGIGVMLHTLNESLRTQATGVNIMAQNMARNNYVDKEQTKAMIDSAKQLKVAMRQQRSEFITPRF